MNISQRFLTSFALIRLFRRVTAGLLFMSAHDPGFCVAGRIIAALRRVPLVFDVQDSQLVFGAERDGGVRQYVKTWLEAFAVRGAQRVWVPTESLRLLLHRHYGLPAGVIAVVPNGVRCSRYSDVTRESEESNVLLHLGGPRAYYDSDMLIDCFARVLDAVPEAKLRFLGIRNDSYTFNTRRKCVMNGMRDSVEFLPPVPSDQVASFMDRAVIGVHTYALRPAYSATIGMKIAEYMAAGLPILHRGPRFGETWKLVESQRVGLCAETVDELAGKAIELLKRPTLRRELGNRGRSLASRFDWNNVLKSVVDDIHSLVQPGATITPS